MRTRILVACLVPALLLAAAGCSKSPDGGGVASAGGSATPSPTPSLSFLAQGIRYAQCMRQHGVESFPDPDADGRIRLPEEQTDPDYDQAKAACDAQSRSARPSAGATS